MRNNTSISRQLREKILALKGSNMSYREMSKEVGCCKSTVHYHLTPGAAEKIKKRSGREEWRSVWRFCYEPKKKKKPLKYKINTLLRKKFRAFLYGATRKNQTRRNKMGLKHKTTKIFHVLAKLWPGIAKENQVFQAVNQWTNKKDYYPDGKPIMTPYVRCKLTDEVINVKANTTHCDHINGDPSDNSVENFSATHGWANQMKGDAPNYDVLEKRLETMLTTIKKYKNNE